MPRKRKLPYLNKIGQRGRIQLWLVDGAYVRTHLDEEFNNFGYHQRFDFIPPAEIWIDRQLAPDEQNFYIEHAVYEQQLLKRGMSYEDAHEKANEREMSARQQTGDRKKVALNGQLPDPSRVHVRLWKKLASGPSVWVVDGRLVRSVFDVDFTEGGHEHVYEYVPHDEVWIDDDITDLERPYVLLHELHERNLMAKGMDYDQAHTESSKLEKEMRHNPAKLHKALAEEGWE